MRPIKVNGMRDLQALSKRVVSAHNLGRIGYVDFMELCRSIGRVEAIIINMIELDENGEEIEDAYISN